jgi:hypothetical protein
MNRIISDRAAADLGTDASDARDVARAILRAESREPGSWLPWSAEAAEWLECDGDVAAKIGVAVVGLWVTDFWGDEGPSDVVDAPDESPWFGSWETWHADVAAACSDVLLGRDGTGVHRDEAVRLLYRSLRVVHPTRSPAAAPALWARERMTRSERLKDMGMKTCCERYQAAIEVSGFGGYYTTRHTIASASRGGIFTTPAVCEAYQHGAMASTTHPPPAYSDAARRCWRRGKG